MKAPDYDMFKGHPVMIIYTGKEYKGEHAKLTIGYRKARAICDQIDHIRRFVEKCEMTGDNELGGR